MLLLSIDAIAELDADAARTLAVLVVECHECEVSARRVFGFELRGRLHRVVLPGQLEVLIAAGIEVEAASGQARAASSIDSATHEARGAEDADAHAWVHIARDASATGNAGAGRADAEHDVFLFDRFEVVPLLDALRRHLLSARGLRAPRRKYSGSSTFGFCCTSCAAVRTSPR